MQTARFRPPASVDEICHLSMSVWLTDLDVYGELNNAKYLTLMEIARWDMSARSGLVALLRKNRWGFVVAGCSIRYRKRLTLFQRFDMQTRLIGADDRWFYMEQNIFRHGVQHTGALFRTGVLDAGKIVEPARVSDQLGISNLPAKPDWVEKWDESDNSRPWASN